MLFVTLSRLFAISSNFFILVTSAAGDTEGGLPDLTDEDSIFLEQLEQVPQPDLDALDMNAEDIAINPGRGEGEGEGEGEDDLDFGEGDEDDDEFFNEEREECRMEGPIANFSIGYEFADISLSYEEASQSCLQIRDCVGVTCPTEHKPEDKTPHCRVRWNEGKIYGVKMFPFEKHSTYYKLCKDEEWDPVNKMVKIPPDHTPPPSTPVPKGTDHGIGTAKTVAPTPPPTRKGDATRPTMATEPDEPSIDMEAELRNFVASQTLTIEVKARDKEIFHETFVAPLKSKKIHGVFFSEYNEDNYETIQIIIYGPTGEQIYTTGKRVDGVFKVEVDAPGTYEIHVLNDHMFQPTWVTMMFGGKEVLEGHHIDKLNASVETLTRLVRGIQQEGMYLWERQNAGLHHISGVSLNCLALRTFEFLVMAFMAALQIVYVKSLCSHRRII